MNRLLLVLALCVTGCGGAAPEPELVTQMTINGSSNGDYAESINAIAKGLHSDDRAKFIESLEVIEKYGPGRSAATMRKAVDGMTAVQVVDLADEVREKTIDYLEARVAVNEGIDDPEMQKIVADMRASLEKLKAGRTAVPKVQ